MHNLFQQEVSQILNRILSVECCMNIKSDRMVY
jgi:hypothetical protein